MEIYKYVLAASDKTTIKNTNGKKIYITEIEYIKHLYVIIKEQTMNLKKHS
ncbi:hypothetical protein G8S49_11580 [Clostridium botulinum C]|uniref:Uncharacterized protein n=1 Tax=Clostridium botulinum C TaxID=36828 RepID=A0A9Q3VB68_CLOBO|nr:hypothetical protein [Clostridium botulinum]MCD3195794.1 hypothetical protein [Clostridium botulinum C]MCD3201210.1 hypothetical protein [Clostridium botulinum C]MCD3206535.1 hypothetical protein [Clostridium botulinum C]MCD3209166.1 hypothetical protein [Clostridium botulinum C]MCD3226353.1 hypothetical protein [Clostridium botulinum C]